MTLTTRTSRFLLVFAAVLGLCAGLAGGQTLPPTITIARPAPDVEHVTVRQGQPVHLRVPIAHLEHVGRMAHLKPWAWDAGGPVIHQPAKVRGFNVAFAYTQVGTYTVTLDGSPRAVVSVEADTRAPIRVRDFPGLQAAAKVRDALVEIEAASIEMPQSLSLADGVTLRSANGGQARLIYTAPLGRFGVMVWPGKRCTIQNVTFTVAGGEGNTDKTRIDAIAGNDDLTVMGVVFGNVDSGINGNTAPSRVYLGGSSAEGLTSLRCYLAWVEGEDWAIVGNRAFNSTREHIVRISASNRQVYGSRYIHVGHNDFDNADRRPEGDQYDYDKSTINGQVVQYMTAIGNNLGAVLEFGPLGEGDGFAAGIERRCRWAVIAGNSFHSRGWVRIKHGASSALILGNDFAEDSVRDYGLITVEKYHPEYQRGVSDLYIMENRYGGPFTLIRLPDDVEGELVVQQ